MSDDKTPHELWVEAEGNPGKYRELLRAHGLLVPRTSTPEPHYHNGLTRACLCLDCGGTYNAPWHIKEAA